MKHFRYISILCIVMILIAMGIAPVASAGAPTWYVQGTTIGPDGITWFSSLGLHRQTCRSIGGNTTCSWVMGREKEINSDTPQGWGMSPIPATYQLVLTKTPWLRITGVTAPEWMRARVEGNAVVFDLSQATVEANCPIVNGQRVVPVVVVEVAPAWWY